MPDLNALLPGIPFVVVGGTATSLYMPTRTTKDVDILVTSEYALAVGEALKRAGAKMDEPLDIRNPLRISGDSWKLADGSELDVLTSAEAWAREALASPNRDDAGLPIVSLPYLALMKLASGRGIDMGDLSRMLGAADDSTLEEVRAVVVRYLPDAVGDMDSLAALGKLELLDAPPDDASS